MKTMHILSFPGITFLFLLELSVYHLHVMDLEIFCGEMMHLNIYNKITSSLTVIYCN